MNRGKWNKEEIKLYDKYTLIYKNNYKLMSFYITTRSAIQIRSRHQKEFQKKIKFALILLKLKQN